jgi:diadenylate cyclase
MFAAWDNFILVMSQIRPLDLLDLVLVWVVVYRVLLLTKHSGAVQILSGIGVLAVVYIMSTWLQLFTFNWLLDKFFSNLFLIVVILFQGEIRRALAQLGSTPFLYGVSKEEEAHVVEEIAKGAISLAQKGYGALLVVEREIELDYFIEKGTVVNGNVSAEMICTIFEPTSPLHDGALVIRGGRLYAAGCFLPLSKNPILDRNLGTRHRAAIGLTEETDAFVLVISEENNSVGLVQGGQLIPNVDHATIRKKLYETFELKIRASEAKGMA